MVLLVICTSSKADLEASVAEFMYGEPLRITGELLTLTADPMEPTNLITACQHMAHLRPVPAADQASPATFVHKDLYNCTHVFLRQDTTRRILESPYSGPYQVLSWRGIALQIFSLGKHITVSADRVKPAYVLKGTESESTTFNPSGSATQSIAPWATQPPSPVTQTTRFGRHFLFSALINTFAAFSAEG
jgi:hypothetical protein